MAEALDRGVVFSRRNGTSALGLAPGRLCRDVREGLERSTDRQPCVDRQRVRVFPRGAWSARVVRPDRAGKNVRGLRSLPAAALGGGRPQAGAGGPRSSLCLPTFVAPGGVRAPVRAEHAALGRVPLDGGVPWTLCRRMAASKAPPAPVALLHEALADESAARTLARALASARPRLGRADAALLLGLLGAARTRGEGECAARTAAAAGAAVGDALAQGAAADGTPPHGAPPS